ncbi:hypothetical protein Tco_1135436 [Tanacetum coccineum]
MAECDNCSPQQPPQVRSLPLSKEMVKEALEMQIGAEDNASEMEVGQGVYERTVQRRFESHISSSAPAYGYWTHGRSTRSKLRRKRNRRCIGEMLAKQTHLRNFFRGLNVREHVSIKLLNKDYYHEWVLQPEKFLQANGMSGYVNGVFEDPDPIRE